MLNIATLIRGIKTATFTESQVSAGFFGFFDTTTNAARRVFYTNGGVTPNNSDWTGVITGVRCIMRCGGGASSPFLVSVDNGPWVNAQRISGLGSTSDHTCPIFDGLPDCDHLVRIRCMTGFSGSAWSFVSGDLFTVTGRNPNVSFPLMGTKWMLTDASFPGLHTFTLIARPAGANVAPTNNNTDYSTPANYARGGALKIRAQCSDIWVFTGDTSAHYSIDAAAMVQKTLIDFGGWRGWQKIASGLDNTAAHDYVITTGGGVAGGGPPLGVMIGGAGATYSAIPTTKRWVEYGDSRTFAASTYTGQTADVGNLYKTGAALGFLAAHCGQSGDQVSTTDTNLATMRAARGFTEDVAVIEIGRNDGSTASGAFQTSYSSIISKLKAAGVGKVLCKGTAYGGDVSFTNHDADIQTCVTAAADPTVVYIPVTTWTGIAGISPNGGDGTHPQGDAGYATMSGYEVTAYAPYV